MSGSLVVLLAALAELANGLSMTAAGPRVYLTREAGKNGKLQTLLEHRGVPSVELPCIEFQSLPGAAELPAMLTSGSFGWVVITSPEAASVFLEAWAACGRPALRVATVGAASASVLDAAGLPVEFVPSKATAKVLAAELPVDGDAPVLFPCSALARDELANGLTTRGVSTERVATYTTVGATWDDEAHALARQADVVSFGSPSAVNVWAERVGTSAVAACIGKTSADAAKAAGFGRVVYPESPGVEAWADSVVGLDLW
jgi:uroporphyrinogen-III synthase